MKKINLLLYISLIIFSFNQCKEMKNAAETSLTGNRANVIEVVNHKEKIDPMGLGQKGHRTIYVTIKNTSSQLIEMVGLKGVWYDKDENIVGTGPGIGMNIPAGQTKVVEVTGIDINNAIKYKIEIETGL